MDLPIVEPVDISATAPIPIPVKPRRQPVQAVTADISDLSMPPPADPSDLSATLTWVVDTQGRAFEDTVLIDESVVSPLLIAAQVHSGLEDTEETGQIPLDASEFDGD